MQMKVKVQNNKPLTIDSDGKEKVLAGDFKLIKNNLAFFINKKSSWQRDYDLPERLRFDGNWRFDNNHLVFKVSKINNINAKPGTQLKAELVSADNRYLLAKIKTVNTRGNEKISYFKLQGNWRADKFNRLQFSIKKPTGRNKLTFSGRLNLTKNNYLQYTFEPLKTKTKKSFVFKGFWDIRRKRKLIYQLANSSDKLIFSAGIQSPNLYPAKDTIKYRIISGYKKDRYDNYIVLAGTWKLSRPLGLSFSIDYGKYRKKIKVGARLKIFRKYYIQASLLDKSGRPLGLSVRFSRRMLAGSDYQYFLKLAQQRGNLVISAGGKIYF
jgi:hypothetical protein